MRIGVDLGGTKTEFIALSDSGEILQRFRHPTPAEDYFGTVDAIRAGVERLESRLNEAGTVGIGIPGSISPASGLVRNANSTWLNGKDLGEDLSAALQREVRLANDANCFALSESVDGAAREARTVFGVILGTGVGGGIAIDGEILPGRNLIAGEWGHNPIPQESPQAGLKARQCWCGRQNCIETWLSGPALERTFAEATDQRLTASEIASRADAGDQGAERIMADYEHLLASALSAVINIIDPDAIVLGGGLSNIRRLYRTVPAIWAQRVFSDAVDTELVPPVHGDSSGVRGAAWLWKDKETREAR
jgi:fructokinase